MLQHKRTLETYSILRGKRQRLHITLRSADSVLRWKAQNGCTQRQGKGVAGEGAENDAYEHRGSFWGEGNILELDSAAGM